MRKSKVNILGLFILTFALILGVFYNTVNVDAATSGGYALKVGGSNTDNLNIDNGSYVITGDPGQKVELKLLVINKESNKRKFVYDVNTAYTNNSGNVSYDKTKVTDPSLKIQTRKLVTPNHAVFEVPGNTTATLTVNMTVPTKKFDGYLMGGFTVSPYDEKAKGTVSSNGTLIKNKFSYSIPIQVHLKGDEGIAPKYSVMSVKPAVNTSEVKNRPGVVARVHNSTNSYVGSLNSEAVVTKKGDKSFKIKQTANGQTIAPTSNYNYAISWGKKSLQSGNYHLKLTYKVPGGIRSWVINKDFTITNNDAAKYNKLSGIKPNYLWLWILLAVLALAIILGLGIYLGKRNNNKNNNGNNNSGSKTRKRRR